MDKPDPKVTDAIRRDVEAPWHRFLDLYEPLRPELYRYCRHLTRSPWDADELVQDALFRAFAKLGCMNEPPENPRRPGRDLRRASGAVPQQRLPVLEAVARFPRASIESASRRARAVNDARSAAAV